MSAGDQQRLQAVLSSVRSKATVLTLMQEAKAQSEVSETQKTQGDEAVARSMPGNVHELRVPESPSPGLEL